MGTIDNILNFLDGLENGKGKVMAKTIRNERKFLENPEKDLTTDIKENFETFLHDYDLQGYRNELKIMLDVAYYANVLYVGKSIITQRQTKDRVNPEPKISKTGKLYYPKNNYPLLEDLKALKNYDYSVMDLNLDEVKNKYPGKTIDKILPFEVLSISIKDKTETYNIKSKELLKVAEAAIIKRLKEYYENGTFKRLQNTPSKKQNIRKFANNYLIPVYYYLKQIWPQKSKPFIIQATMDFWGTFYSNPYSDESNFRKEILGES
ncbi:MAG: hypothetical protein ACOCWG_06330 [bacterium]